MIKYKCLSCNKDYPNKLDKISKSKLKNIFKFSNNDINKLILLFTKAVYPSEYLNDWENFNERALPVKKNLYSNLNMEEIIDADSMHGKKDCKDFKIKDLGEYHSLYFKSDTFS